LTLLLAAGLPVLQAAAQNAPPQGAAANAKAVPQYKPHQRPKKAAPDPPAQQAPAPPPTLEQSPPAPPQVTYNNGQLTIVSQNATLSQVLRSVQLQTGASVEMPSGVSSERVVGQLGPGQPRDVLNSLLNGSKFNYILLGVNGNPGAVQKVILTTAKPASTTNTAQNNAPPLPEEPQEEESVNEPEPQPQAPLTPQFRHRPNMPGRMPEAFNPQSPQPQPAPVPDNSGDAGPTSIKTPDQLLQELQQMQQQQQQMQEQLNPANRQPPQ
jgi:hypothetical protein